MSQRPWTMKELQFLRDKHKELYLPELAEHLKRTVSSVKGQMNRSGLSIKRQEYAIYKGDTFIISGTADELAKEMNVSRDYIYWLATPAAKRRRPTIAVRI